MCALLLPLPIGRLPGVGKVTEEKLGIKTVGNLQDLQLPTLEDQFGRYGLRLYELSRGIDTGRVVPNRPTKSISAEDTFERDVPLSETEPMTRLSTWARMRAKDAIYKERGAAVTVFAFYSLQRHYSKPAQRGCQHYEGGDHSKWLRSL